MLIKQAFAQDTTAVSAPAASPATATVQAGTTPPTMAPPPSGTEMILWNVGFVVLMIVMFYMLLIRPQQSRYREHAQMLKAMKKGDKIILQSGMIAVIDQIADNDDELTVELGAGHKVQILRSAIAGKYDEIVKKK